MDTVYFAFNYRPKSFNSRQLEPYHSLLRSDFYRNFSYLYTCIPFNRNDDIQTDILYIDRTKTKAQMLDIDNISKPIVDSFNGAIYYDDNQVVRRTATHLRATTYDITEIDCTDLPYEIVQIIELAISGKKEQAVVLKVSKINLSLMRGKFL